MTKSEQTRWQESRQVMSGENYEMAYHSVLFSKKISWFAKSLHAVLVGLHHRKGYAYATNEYLAELLGVSERTVAGALKELRDNDFIISKIERDAGGRIRERRLYPLVAKADEWGELSDEFDEAAAENPLPAADEPCAENCIKCDEPCANFCATERKILHSPCAENCAEKNTSLTHKKRLQAAQNSAHGFSAGAASAGSSDGRLAAPPPEESKGGGTVAEALRLGIEKAQASKNEKSAETAKAPQGPPPKDAALEGITPFQEKYAKEVYAKWRDAGLPCSNDYWQFLTRDFKLALFDLHKQKLTSNEVMQAIKNYTSVIALKRAGNTNWQKELRFYEFVEQKNIMKFMDGFRLSDFEKSEAQRQIEEERRKKRGEKMTDDERSEERKRQFLAAPPENVIVPDGMPLEAAYEKVRAGDFALLGPEELDKYRDAYLADGTVVIVTNPPVSATFGQKDDEETRRMYAATFRKKPPQGAANGGGAARV